MKHRLSTAAVAIIASMASFGAYAQSTNPSTPTGKATEQQQPASPSKATSNQSGADQSGADQSGQNGNSGSQQHHASLSRERVQQVQTALKSEDPNLPVDGVWGPKTKKALRAFQKANGLPPTAHLDKQTAQKLNLPQA